MIPRIRAREGPQNPSTSSLSPRLAQHNIDRPEIVVGGECPDSSKAADWAGVWNVNQATAYRISSRQGPFSTCPPEIRFMSSQKKVRTIPAGRLKSLIPYSSGCLLLVPSSVTDVWARFIERRFRILESTKRAKPTMCQGGERFPIKRACVYEGPPLHLYWF